MVPPTSAMAGMPAQDFERAKSFYANRLGLVALHTNNLLAPIGECLCVPPIHTSHVENRRNSKSGRTRVTNTVTRAVCAGAGEAPNISCQAGE